MKNIYCVFLSAFLMGTALGGVSVQVENGKIISGAVLLFYFFIAAKNFLKSFLQYRRES